MRGIYLATHFNNFYEAASPEELERYVEDLSLWGFNLLALAYPHWQYAGYDDPAAQNGQSSSPDHAGGKAGGHAGHHRGCVNGGFTSTPKEMRCTARARSLGQTRQFRRESLS